jgi:hypothetical protein
MAKRPIASSRVSFIPDPEMLNAIFTLDYEIHGNGEGSPEKLMLEPTHRMLDQFARHGAKLTVMADVAEILKFKEFKEKTGRDVFHYEAIADQLRETVRRGHDVQLHLHASYFNSRYADGRWAQDWSEYNFAGLPYERLNEIVRIGKNYLEQLLQPVNRNYRCVAFRAANWAVSPSQNVVRALTANGIRIESSVFKHGRRDGIVSFDYSNAHSHLAPWPADENDICRRDTQSRLTEVPIYCERRWLGAFLTLNRIYRAGQTRKHSIHNSSGPGNGRTHSPAKTNKLLSRLKLPFRLHAWKADFNQCSGRQLARALARAEADFGSSAEALPFVLIGHSKIYTRLNEWSLDPFLAFVANNPARFGFATLSDCQGRARRTFDAKPALASPPVSAMEAGLLTRRANG